MFCWGRFKQIRHFGIADVRLGVCMCANEINKRIHFVPYANISHFELKFVEIVCMWLLNVDRTRPVHKMNNTHHVMHINQMLILCWDQTKNWDISFSPNEIRIQNRVAKTLDKYISVSLILKIISHHSLIHSFALFLIAQLKHKFVLGKISKIFYSHFLRVLFCSGNCGFCKYRHLTLEKVW